MFKGQYFNRPEYLVVDNVSVRNIACPIQLNEDMSVLDVQVIELRVRDINILINPGEDLEPLQKIIDSKKKKDFPPHGIDYIAATMAKLGGWNVGGAAITDITQQGTYGGLLLEAPRIGTEYLIPAEVPHSIGVALIEDACVFVKQKIYDMYEADVKARDAGKHKKDSKFDFGMHF